MTKYTELILTSDSLTYFPFSPQLYSCDARAYKQLMKAWISWAFQNNIPCDSTHYLFLPNAKQYIQQKKAKKWTGKIFRLGSSRK